MGDILMTLQIIINNGPAGAPAGKLMEFDGGAATFVGTQLLAWLITGVTLGICYPYALVLQERWRAKHTTLHGRRLDFKGTGIGLFGLWIKWLFLIVITIGIYSFLFMPRITHWKIENTVYAS